MFYESFKSLVSYLDIIMVTSHRLVENIHRFDLPIHSFISSFFLGQYLYPLL
ncbi:XXYS1_4_G0023560.mRNA.1.CDS.1, partial [Saccharomyces cerevisiae]